MALSDSTIHKLADVLVPEILNYIRKDERWIEFMIEMISDCVNEKIGKIDDDLFVELSQSIMERILIIKDPCVWS